MADSIPRYPDPAAPMPARTAALYDRLEAAQERGDAQAVREAEEALAANHA